MLDGMTSRLATKWFGFAGIGLFVFCLVLVVLRMYTFPDPKDEECNAIRSAEVETADTLKDNAGFLRVIGVLPKETTINRHICIVVAGVVTSAAERRLADAVERAQRLRDDAQKDYEKAAEAERDGAWVNLQKAQSELGTALADAAAQPQPIALSVFLNGKTAAALTVSAYAKAAPQVLRIRLAVPPNAGDDGTPFWRELLSASSASGGTADGENKGQQTSGTQKENQIGIGRKIVTVGLSRSTATMPEAVDEGKDKLTVVIYDARILWIGVAAFVCFLISFCGLARHTTLLRDNARTEPAASLTAETLEAARKAEAEAVAKEAEMAAAKAKAEAEAKAADDAMAEADAAGQAAAKSASEVAAATLKIAVATHESAVAAHTNATAKLKAAEANAVRGARNGEAEQPLGPYSLAKTQMAFWLFLTIAGFIFIWLSMGVYLGLITGGILVLLGINAATGLASVKMTMDDDGDKKSNSQSFFADILNDGEGPQLHRIQVVAWTLVLGIIFVWNVFWNFTFVDFDTNLLLLIGVAQGMYLGFKTQEAPAKQ